MKKKYRKIRAVKWVNIHLKTICMKMSDVAIKKLDFQRINKSYCTRDNTGNNHIRYKVKALVAVTSTCWVGAGDECYINVSHKFRSQTRVINWGNGSHCYY